VVNGQHLQRLTFPFPFVHHQPHDWKVEQLLTVETKGLLMQIIVFLFYDFEIFL